MAAPRPGQKFRVLYDFTAEEDGEMTVRAGAVVVVIGEADLRNSVGRIGNVTPCCCRLVER